MGIAKAIKKLPASPGVYIFFGEKKETLYIGKASNLKKRVASYFQKKSHAPKINAMVSRVTRVDYIPTATAEEALIYEAGLIKQKKPKYNAELKDDKSYPLLELTVKDKFPGLFITRAGKKSGALYYGPYTNVKLLKKALAVIKSVFPLRSCRKMPKKPCLKAHIGTCVSPCDGSISEKEYGKIVSEVKLFLQGKMGSLLKKLSDRMLKASGSMDYEKALALKERIEALGAIQRGRKPPPPLNRDITELKNALGLKALPFHIEAFDISNIQGKEAVGSMVSFFNGKPQKSEYRRFRIKYTSGIDDYAMIREVIKRRYTRLLKEKGRLPDLILIDGGKGHLRAAGEELRKIGPLNIRLVSIAKAKEDVYTEGKKKPLGLSRNSSALMLIMRMRDEAHRFAISYHKFLRSKNLKITAFQKKVYKTVSLIPRGETRSYKWVAEKCGFPKAYRAVGRALRRNPYIGKVPCHRVIKSDGSPGGFAKGKAAKKALLRREGLDVK